MKITKKRYSVIFGRLDVKKTKRKLSFFLAAVLAVSVLMISCSEKAEEDEETEAEAVEVPQLVLADNGRTDFTVVRAEEAAGYELDTAFTVYKKLGSLYSSDFRLSNDWYRADFPTAEDPTNKKEILLFETQRAESQQALADLDFDGYIIRATENKLVVVASSPACSNAALHELFDVILPENTKDGVTSLPVGFEVKKEMDDSGLFDLGTALKEGREVSAQIKKVFRYSGSDGFGTAQGVATDGEYVYTAMKKKSGGKEVDRIVKIDMDTWEIVKESETLPLDHANDMTYDPVNNRIIVVNMVQTLITFVDPEELTVIGNASLPYSQWAVGCIPSSGQFAFLASGGYRVTDADFNLISTNPCQYESGYTGQGMDTDDRFAYIPLSPGEKNNNIIQIHDVMTGELLGKVKLKTSMESESMFHVGDEYYIQFNHGGSSIYSIEFCEGFE